MTFEDWWDENNGNMNCMALESKEIIRSAYYAGIRRVLPDIAIQAEASVEVDRHDNDLHYVCVDIDEYRHLPAYAEGKKVKVLIWGLET
jgi:hypothetical protein